MAVKKEKGNTTLSDAEKEKLIIKLLSENKPWNKITQLLHVSPNTISNVNKKNKGIKNQPPVDIQALKMFEDGKQPIDVAIALETGTEETLKYYSDYLLLKAEEELSKARAELKRDLVPFINLYKEKKSNNYSLEEMKEALRIGRKRKEALNGLAIIEREKEQQLEAIDKLIRERDELHKRISVAKHELESLELSKQFSIIGVQSRTEQKGYTERHLPPNMLSMIEEIVRKNLCN